MNKTTLLSLIGGIAVAFAALFGGVWAANSLMAPATVPTEQLDATYMPEGRAVTDFELVDHNGDAFTPQDLEGNWDLVFFGFTHCPDMCPTTMAELRRVQDMLAAENRADAVDVVFITVDPERDTPERMKDYVTGFDASFTGVTGSLDAIDVLARDLGIAHTRHNDDVEEGENYDVDHGLAVLLINPQGRLQAMFGSPHDATSIEDDLTTILDAHGTAL